MGLAAGAIAHGIGGLGALALMLLVLCGFVGGVGITSLGPGGVLVTIGLFGLSGLPAAAVAGTAIATHIGSGSLGTAAYLRSGQLRERHTRTAALTLIAGAVIGTPLGVLANAHVSHAGFGAVLGVSVTALGVLLGVREHRRATRPRATDRHPPAILLLAIGIGVAVLSGLLGLGGPLLSVPLLTACGVAMLPALAAAQAQSIVIAGTGAIAYVARGAVSWPLVLVVGIPELAGVLIGWKLAHALPAHRLRAALCVVLIAAGSYLIIHNL